MTDETSSSYIVVKEDELDNYLVNPIGEIENEFGYYLSYIVLWSKWIWLLLILYSFVEHCLFNFQLNR